MSIDMNEWDAEINSLGRGITERYNHDKCPAGRDTKRRLYLTRPAGSPGIVLAYCHNCQESGISRKGCYQYRDFDITLPQPMISSTIPFHIPNNIVYQQRQWPNAAKAWRIKMHLPIHDCIKAQIGYDPTSDRMYLPIFESLQDGETYGSDILGYQLRRLMGPGPKYLTASKDKNTILSTRIFTHDRCPQIGYVVEDLASGLAILRGCDGEKHDVSVTVNYGTKICIESLALNKNISHGVVWLDNDSDHVIDQAQHIARVWNLVSGKQTYIEKSLGDPKSLDVLDMTKLQRVHTTWKV